MIFVIAVKMIGGMKMSTPKDNISQHKKWTLKQLKRQETLLKAEWDNPPKTQREKDIFNLKYMMYNIGYGSLCYRMGCYGSLKRAVKLLEKENEHDGTDN